MQVGWSLFLEAEDDPSLTMLDLLWKNRIPRVLQIPNSTLPVVPCCSQQSLAPRPPWYGNGPGMQFYSPLCLYRLAQGGQIHFVVNHDWSYLIGLLVGHPGINILRYYQCILETFYLVTPVCHPCNVPKLHFAVWWLWYAESQKHPRNMEDSW